METLSDNLEVLTKTCSKCGETKLHAEFYKHKHGKYGLDSRCKACNALKMEEYRKTHREYFRNQSARYRKNNPEASRQANKNWMQAHPEYERERYKRRRQDPQQVEKMRASNQRRKARGRVASELVDTLTLEQTMWLRSQCCSYCMGQAGEIDHVVPLLSGGDNSIDNLVPCCRKCNAQKGAKSLLHFLLARKRRDAEVAHGLY